MKSVRKFKKNQKLLNKRKLSMFIKNAADELTGYDIYQVDKLLY